MPNSVTDNLFAALNMVVLSRVNTAYFRIIGVIPAWLNNFVEGLEAGQEVFIPEESFPFLGNFIIDAEEYWLSQNSTPLKSGLWSAVDLLGNECALEATAVSLDGEKVLLIEFFDADAYHNKQSVLQIARERQLNYDNLRKEVQKKEVLLHCIMHDLAGLLTGINCCFALLELENLSPKGQERLEIGRKQSLKQEILIRDIMNAFSADIQNLESYTLDPVEAPDALICAQEVIAEFLPCFTVDRVRLQLADSIDVTADWRVLGERSRLERVFANLLENALRHSPPESTVTVHLQQDGDSILITVEDGGTGIDPEMSSSLFQKFSPAKKPSGSRAGIGLYFCRMTIERWGGNIGYSPRPGNGSQFWFRLPKIFSFY